MGVLHVRFTRVGSADELLRSVSKTSATKIRACGRFKGNPMRENDERRMSVEHITDEEVASTIRYLDPNPSSKGTNDEASTFSVICLTLIVLAVGVLGYIWLYLQTS